MSYDGIRSLGPVSVRVAGMNRTLRALSKAGADAQNMRQLMHEIGMIAVRAAKPKTPVLSGALRRNIRAGKGKTKAVVRAGGARVPYAPVVHYGWPARNIPAQPYLVQAAVQQQGAMIRRFEDGIDELLVANDLK